MKATFGVGLVSGMLVLSGGYAAESTVHLKNIQGLVLVSQGNGFSTAGEGMSLVRGDRVMVMDHGAVSMVYPNGCQTKYMGSQIVTIEPTSCKGMKAKQVGQMYSAVGEAAAADAGAGGGAAAVAGPLLPVPLVESA